MWLLMPAKYISSSISTMAPFIFISLEDEQNIMNIGIQVIISDSYDINQRLCLKCLYQSRSGHVFVLEVRGHVFV